MYNLKASAQQENNYQDKEIIFWMGENICLLLI
jgi:hypothetical protein